MAEPATRVSKDRLRLRLQEAMEDVALLMAARANEGTQLLEVRQTFVEIWEMAGLGEVPEYEIRTSVVKAS